MRVVWPDGQLELVQCLLELRRHLRTYITFGRCAPYVCRPQRFHTEESTCSCSRLETCVGGRVVGPLGRVAGLGYFNNEETVG